MCKGLAEVHYIAALALFVCVLRLLGAHSNGCFADGEGRKNGFGTDLGSGRSIVIVIVL